MGSTTAFIDEPYATSGVVGSNFAMRTTEPMFRLGTTAVGTDNTAWVYVKTTATLAAGACGVNATTFVAASGTGYTATAAFAANSYGWVKNTAGAV